MKLKIPAWLPLVFFVLVYLIPLAARPLLAPDEFRYAEIPASMLDSGDFVSPKLLGVRYFEKPALGYQLTALSMAVFGRNAFADRLPAALSVLFTALLIGWFVGKKTGNVNTARLAELMFLGGGMVFGVGTFAVLDSQTSFFLTGMMLTFAVAKDEKRYARRLGLTALCGLFCAGAFLTKGFLAFAVPVVGIGAYLLWSRRFRLIVDLPWWAALATLLAAALPWSVMIHLREPEFWRYFFWVEHIQRFTSETPGQHAAPWWLLVPPLLAGLFPAALAGLGAIPAWKKHWREFLKDDDQRFLLCYLALPFLFFSASSCKLATYAQPCFPPLAMLLALGAARYIGENPEGKWVGAVMKVFAVAVGLVGIFAPAVQFFIYPFCDRGQLPFLFAACLCYVAGAAVLLGNANWGAGRLVALFFALLAPMWCLTEYVTPNRIWVGKGQEVPLRKLASELPANAIVVTAPNAMHAVGWVFPERELRFFWDPGELEYSVVDRFPDEYGHRLLGFREMRKLIDAPDRDRPVALIARVKPQNYDEDREEYARGIGREYAREFYTDEIWMAIFE